MGLRSRDRRPYFRLVQFYSTMPLLARQPATYVKRVPWGDRHLYPDGILKIQVYYAVPVLGTKGPTSMCQEFTHHVFESFDLKYGYRFYRQKLTSYHARLDARYQHLYEQNRNYYDNLAHMHSQFQK